MPFYVACTIVITWNEITRLKPSQNLQIWYFFSVDDMHICHCEDLAQPTWQQLTRAGWAAHLRSLKSSDLSRGTSTECWKIAPSGPDGEGDAQIQAFQLRLSEGVLHGRLQSEGRMHWHVNTPKSCQIPQMYISSCSYRASLCRVMYDESFILES